MLRPGGICPEPGTNRPFYLVNSGKLDLWRFSTRKNQKSGRIFACQTRGLTHEIKLPEQELNRDHTFNQYTVATYNLLDHKWDLTVKTIEIGGTPSAFEIIPGTNYFIIKRLNDFVVVTNRGGEWEQQTISRWGYVSTIEPGPDFFVAEVENQEYNLVTYRWTDAGEWDLEQTFSTGTSYETYGIHASQYMIVAGGSERMDVFSWQNGKDWLRTAITAQNSCIGMRVDGFGVGGRHAVLLATDAGEDDRRDCDRVVAKTAVHTGLPELYRKNLAFTDVEGLLTLEYPYLTVDGSGFAISAYEDKKYPIMRIHKKYQENFEEPAHAYVCTKKTVIPSARSNDRYVYQYDFQPSKTRFDTHTGTPLMEEVRIEVPSGGSVTKKFYIGVPDSDPVTGSPGMPEYYRGLVQSEEISSEERTISRTEYVYDDLYADGWAPGVYTIHLTEKEVTHDNVNAKTEYEYKNSKNGLPSEAYVSTDDMCKETEIEYAFEQISGLEEKNMLTLVSKESTYEVEDCKRYAAGRSHALLRTLSLEWNKNGTLRHKKLWNGTLGEFTTFTSNTLHDAGRVLESKSGPLVGKGLWTSTIYDRDMPVGSADNSKWDEFGVLTCDYDRNGIIDYGEGHRSLKALDARNGWERWLPTENGSGSITLETLPEDDQLFGEKCIKVVNAFGPTRNFKIYPKTDYLMSAWVRIKSATSPTKERFTMGGYFCKSDEGTPEYPYHLPDRPDGGGSSDKFRDFGSRSDIFAPSTANSETWQYVEMLIPAEKVLNGEDGWYARVFFGTPPNTDTDISGGTAYLQDLRFYPADAIVKTKYYDTKHRKPRIEVDANGNAGRRVTYDGFGRPIKWETALFDDDDKLNHWQVVREQEYHLAGESEPVLVPLAPPYGTVAMKSNKAISFKWRVPDQIDVSGPRNYKVYLKEDPSSENTIWELAATVTGEPNQREIQASLEGFSCGEAYAWQVFLGGTYSTPIRSFITPNVKIIRPNGGELRQTGDVLEVEYKAAKPENMSLIAELSKNSGITWEPITLDSYGNWLVEGITEPADKCLVRVSLDCSTADCYPCSDASDDYFTLTPVTEEDFWIEAGAEDKIYDLAACEQIPIKWGGKVPSDAVNTIIRPRDGSHGWKYLNKGAPDSPIRKGDPQWGEFMLTVAHQKWEGEWQISLEAAEGSWKGEKSAYITVESHASLCTFEECNKECQSRGLLSYEIENTQKVGEIQEYLITWNPNENVRDEWRNIDAVRISRLEYWEGLGDEKEMETIQRGDDGWPHGQNTGTFKGNIYCGESIGYYRVVIRALYDTGEFDEQGNKVYGTVVRYQPEPVSCP